MLEKGVAMEKAKWIGRALGVALAALALSGCGEKGGEGGIGAEQLLAADTDTANWITYGRTYSEQRYSPLDQIATGSVGQLGLAWSADLDTARGQ